MTKVIKMGKTGPGGFTVCTECRYFLNLEPDSPRRDVWYNHLCLASPLPTKRDPYDGKVKPVAKNDFGQEYFSDNEFRYCRDVNDGNCPKFENKNKPVQPGGVVH